MVGCHKQVVHKMVEHVVEHEEDVGLHPASVSYAVGTSRIIRLQPSVTMAPTVA